VFILTIWECFLYSKVHK